MTLMRRIRRYAALGVVLAVTAVLVPDAARAPTTMSLVKIEGGVGIDSPDKIVWILAMGSDARLGEDVDRSRADAIQLVGLNFETGDSVIFGVPRDSYVPIPGYGSSRVNAAMVFGGPELMAETVGDMFGVQIDYAFVTSFWGLAGMVKSLGGVTVNSRYAFDDPNLEGTYRVGKNKVNGFVAVHFGRMRYGLPSGDFDRSANQAELIKAIGRKVRANLSKPGFLDAGLISVLRNLDTGINPRELYKLAMATTVINPSRTQNCVLSGSFANIGGASVINPNLTQARAWADDARKDARLDRGC